VEEIARWQKHAEAGGGETGAVTFVQRFTGTLGCSVHFHVLVPDGVFTRVDEGGAVVFRQGPAPTRADLATVAARVEKRMIRWLRRRGLVDERAAEDRSNEAPELSPLEACMQLSLVDSTYLRLAEGGVPVPLDEHRFRAAPGPQGAEVSGFNVHAGVAVRAGDREGLERLCRYCARPPFSLERLSLLPDGRLAYLLRKPRRNGATHLVMTPMQLLARISSLIPPASLPASAPVRRIRPPLAVARCRGAPWTRGESRRSTSHEGSTAPAGAARAASSRGPRWAPRATRATFGRSFW
jgi:hypothetical protein